MLWARVLADLVVLVHVAWVAFIVLGLAAVLIGVARGWSWVRNAWFRGAHLAMIGVVVAESLLGVVCPLTAWEQRLRALGGQSAYTGDFLGYWAHRLLFVRADPWVFTTVYVLFGAAVLAAFLLAPPRRRTTRENRRPTLDRPGDHSGMLDCDRSAAGRSNEYIAGTAMTEPERPPLPAPRSGLLPSVDDRSVSASAARWLWEIFESLPDALFIVNPDGVMIGVNQTASTLTGYARDELLGQPLGLLVPGDPGGHARHMGAFFHAPRARPMGSGLELAVLRKDGGTVPVDISLAPFETDAGRMVVAVARDVSKQRRTERQLRDSQERFDLAVKGSDAGVWDWDLRSNTVYYSARWKSMLGHAEDEIADTFDEWRDRLHPDDRERALATIDAYLAGRTTDYELEHRLRYKDGSYRWILARGAGVRDASGNYYRMVGSHIDVTARRAAEETVRRHESELAAAASIQRYLLPHRSPVLPGFEIAGCCYPAEYTAGDYFDYLGFPDGSIAVMAADVTGHGLGSAIVAASCHSCVQSLSESLSDPSEMLGRLNARVYHETGGELLVSVVIARIDLVRRTLTCYNAGHPAVLVLDAQGREKANLPAENMPLGVYAESTFLVGPEVALAPGDLVLLYTDGLTEAFPTNEDTRMFGLPRALEVVRRHLGRGPLEIVDALYRAVCRYIGTDRLKDDVTIVVIKVG